MDDIDLFHQSLRDSYLISHSSIITIIHGLYIIWVVDINDRIPMDVTVLGGTHTSNAPLSDIVQSDRAAGTLPYL